MRFLSTVVQTIASIFVNNIIGTRVILLGAKLFVAFETAKAVRVGTIASMREIKRVVEVPTRGFAATAFRWLTKSRSAITLDRVIITRRTIGEGGAFSAELAAHERVHAIQQQTLGAKFYGRYFSAQLKVSYARNPYEMEAAVVDEKAVNIPMNFVVLTRSPKP